MTFQRVYFLHKNLAFCPFATEKIEITNKHIKI